MDNRLSGAVSYNRMTWQKLKNPPLKEAAFDLRFHPSFAPDISALEKFCEQFKQEFPQINEMFVVSFRANIIRGKATADAESPNRKRNGFRLSNKEKSFVLQLRSEGLTFSKTGAYVSWEEIRSEVTPIVDRFFSFFPSIRVSRIALRYVNEFHMRFEKSPTEYFKILPTYPETLPQVLVGFSIQLLIPKAENTLHSKIVFNLDPPSLEQVFRVVFDIDVFKNGVYEAKSIKEMLADFEHIRNFKNEIFFSSLTPLTIKMFN